MDDLDLKTRSGLPEALRVLLQDYPREAWEADPGFSGLVQFWLERHMMFRRLTEAMQTDAEAEMDGRLDREAMAPRLARMGNMLIEQLHGHHQIEDHHYFPVLSGLDQRLTRGFEILDRDHHAMDGLLDRFARSANGVLQGQTETGPFRDELLSFSGMLERHLHDEEDLIVPVILRHGAGGLG
ncbi:hemerythrin domain-containing protein [Salipiger mucosus]|uniref:Hemerythrin-like domain-containing protein n=1 Tax=Salipiger mucosus DSM 16094 TaxID=1123237 RepID=S9R456_9RHOB|nr:hemerythrin domain-containing protein [Salipiger mucosus]EPX86788.1 hypothetical protein Salmuc_01436 [Salipiger mucosus DSM 16094]